MTTFPNRNMRHFYPFLLLQTLHLPKLIHQLVFLVFLQFEFPCLSFSTLRLKCFRHPTQQLLYFISYSTTVTIILRYLPPRSHPRDNDLKNLAVSNCLFLNTPSSSYSSYSTKILCQYEHQLKQEKNVWKTSSVNITGSSRVFSNLLANNSIQTIIF